MCIAIINIKLQLPIGLNLIADVFLSFGTFSCAGAMLFDEFPTHLCNDRYHPQPRSCAAKALATQILVGIGGGIAVAIAYVSACL